ncbi:MAG: ABC transporter permease subunit [Rhodobacteraceae bacterium]|nr:ABC transporter permease subunit [Paracoccaceae bacterium]
MDLTEMTGRVLGWTPYLAGGFVTNLMIAAVSMALGTVLGAGLALARSGNGRLLRWPAELLTSLCRNVPSFVLLFYVAFAIPVEIDWGGRVVALPLWIKAALALTIPVIGFASDQTLGLRRQLARGVASARATWVTSWLQYFLIIVMASATASVIGADEIVGRANRVIATDESPAFLVIVYLYVSLWFLTAGLALSAATGWLARHRAVAGRRAAGKPAEAAT